MISLAAQCGRGPDRVNDLKNLRSLRGWDQDVPALLAAIGENAGRSSGDHLRDGAGEPVPPTLPQPLRAVMALRAGAMDHTLRCAAGDGHVPVMIGSGYFAEDGFHPASQGYRAWAGELAGPVAGPRTVSLGVVTRRGDAPDGHNGRLAARIQGLDSAGGSGAPAA
jgi:hypothetical protein